MLDLVFITLPRNIIELIERYLWEKVEIRKRLMRDKKLLGGIWVKFYIRLKK